MGGKRHIKKWMRVTLWSLAVLAATALLLSAMRDKSNGLCRGVEIKLQGNTGNWFVSEATIRQTVGAEELVQKQPVKQINTRDLEDRLERNPWIRNAELFFDSKQVLHIEITERQPLLRVIARNGQSFYLDETGSMLPLSTQFAASLPVFTGFPSRNQFTASDSALAGQMVAMANYISSHEFWKAQVQQVDILKESQFELVPTIGHHRILFGDTANMHSKFDRLQQFYKKVAAVVGFDRYNVLNVQFAGQIVAVKSGQNSITIDTAKANSTIQNFLRQNRQQVNGDDALEQPDTAGAVVADTTARVRRDTARRTVVRAATPPKPTTPKPAATQANRPAAPRTTMPNPPPKPAASTPRAVMRRVN